MPWNHHHKVFSSVSLAVAQQRVASFAFQHESVGRCVLSGCLVSSRLLPALLSVFACCRSKLLCFRVAAFCQFSAAELERHRQSHALYWTDKWQEFMRGLSLRLSLCCFGCSVGLYCTSADGMRHHKHPTPVPVYLQIHSAACGLLSTEQVLAMCSVF